MNPTTDVFEKRMAAIEGGTAALATSSGMAAIFLAITNITAAGDHIISSASLYGGTQTLFQYTLPRFGIEVTFVDELTPESINANVKENTKLVYGETIGNPKGDVPDFESVTAAAHENGLPVIIDNKMVLQRETQAPIWGWADAGEEVTVTFAGQKQTATVGKDGKWMLKFDELKASFEPRKMVITESTGKKVILKNILVGEVWLASGQSNMQHSCTKTTCLKLKVEPVGDAKINPIREFEVKSATAQLHPIEKATGFWKDGEYSGYSGIAFAFAFPAGLFD
jgi:hypothetical protein